MRSRRIAKLAVLGLLALAVVFPVAAYGSDSDEPATDRQIESLDAVGTDFTFQGRLTDAGAPANGTYDFTFYLYTAVAGGSQVGPTNTIGDVAVSAGLFTVSLNFGDQFHGAQYYLEVQVRPGASAGVYTVLSPREPIGSVPNASYASEAGGLLLPQSNAAEVNGTLLTITNPSTASGAAAIAGISASNGLGTAAVSGLITATGPAGSIGVKGVHEGDGIGVYGVANGNGYGVYGYSSDWFGVVGFSSTGTAAKFESPSGTALEVSGPLKATGAKPPAFIHTASAPSNHVTVIDHPSTNNNPTAILIVTQYWSGVYNPHEIGVFYAAGKWRIFNEDIADMPLNAKFNVLVINQ